MDFWIVGNINITQLFNDDRIQCWQRFDWVCRLKKLQLKFYFRSGLLTESWALKEGDALKFQFSGLLSLLMIESILLYFSGVRVCHKELHHTINHWFLTELRALNKWNYIYYVVYNPLLIWTSLNFCCHVKGEIPWSIKYRNNLLFWFNTLDLNK